MRTLTTLVFLIIWAAGSASLIIAACWAFTLGFWVGAEIEVGGPVYPGAILENTHRYWWVGLFIPGVFLYFHPRVRPIADKLIGG